MSLFLMQNREGKDAQNSAKINLHVQKSGENWKLGIQPARKKKIKIFNQI